MTEEEANNEINNIERLDNILNSLVEEFKVLISPKITREHIFDAIFLQLQKSHNLEHPLDFWGLQITYEEAVITLKLFDFNTVFNTIETQADLIPKDLLMNFKVRVKSKGLIWVVHKYDADPFPSNPHAHLLDSSIKMDLSNGKCYKNKIYQMKVKRKDLLKIRAKAEIHFELPKLKS